MLDLAYPYLYILFKTNRLQKITAAFKAYKPDLQHELIATAKQKGHITLAKYLIQTNDNPDWVGRYTVEALTEGNLQFANRLLKKQPRALITTQVPQHIRDITPYAIDVLAPQQAHALKQTKTLWECWAHPGAHAIFKKFPKEVLALIACYLQGKNPTKLFQLPEHQQLLLFYGYKENQDYKSRLGLSLSQSS
jgi:hypothetical protein